MGRAEEIIKAYEAWDPNKESATELASRIGISKARLYQVLEEEDVPPKARRPKRKTSPEVAYLSGWQETNSKPAVLSIEVDSPLVEELAERGVRALLDELRELRDEVAKYRKRYGPLD